MWLLLLPAVSSAAPAPASVSAPASVPASASSAFALFVCVGKLRKSGYNVSVNHVAGMLQLLVAVPLPAFAPLSFPASLQAARKLNCFGLFGWSTAFSFSLSVPVGSLYRRLFWQFRYVSGKTGCLP